MIVSELLNNGTLIRHYSDRGFMLLQNETGAKYSDPVDLVPCMYTYTETDELIESYESTEDEAIDEATEADYLDALRDMGVDL